MTQIKSDWPLVIQDDYGIRPAGKPDECFYCFQKIGTPHKKDCVIVERRIKVQYTWEIEVEIPHFWSPEMFEFHRNQSSSCANNCFHEIRLFSAVSGGGGDCSCPYFTAKFLAETDNAPIRRTHAEEKARENLLKDEEWLNESKKD